MKWACFGVGKRNGILTSDTTLFPDIGPLSMSEPLRLVLRRVGDVEQFPHKLRISIVHALREIQENPAIGDLLQAPRVATSKLGDLSKFNCRSYAFHDPGDQSYSSEEGRIVYRVLADQIDVVAIGKRRGSVVFMEAWARLAPRDTRVPKRMRQHPGSRRPS